MEPAPQDGDRRPDECKDPVLGSTRPGHRGLVWVSAAVVAWTLGKERDPEEDLDERMVPEGA